MAREAEKKRSTSGWGGEKTKREGAFGNEKVGRDKKATVPSRNAQKGEKTWRVIEHKNWGKARG